MTDRFLDNGDGTVTDTQTGLMWEQGEGPVFPWQPAIDRCRDLRLGEYDDWRLPTVQELVGIVNYGRIDPACAPSFLAASDLYWSSTTYRGSQDDAWYVGFDDGDVNADSKGTGHRVLAVRGGLTTRLFDLDNVTRRVTALEDMLRDAWAILANVNHGDWNMQHDEWQTAAERWRNTFNVNVLPRLPK